MAIDEVLLQEAEKIRFPILTGSDVRLFMDIL